MSRRRHYPAHAQRGPELRGLAGFERARADYFLHRNDVGVDGGEDARDSFEPRAPVEAAATMDVVGRHAHGARALRLVRHQSRSKPRSGLEMGSFFASFSASSNRFDNASPLFFSF